MTTKTVDLKGAIVAFCNPLLDISANVSNELLEKYELGVNNAILAESKHLPLYEELVKEYPILYTAGGSAQNTMRAAQWLLPSGSTIFVGCVGVDEYGRKLKDVAEADGLQVEYLEDPTSPTGTCACLITNEGHCRSLVANLGAANNYKIDHILSPRMKVILDQAQCVYISGYFFTVSPETIMKVIKEAHELGEGGRRRQTVCLNLSAPFICQFFSNQLLEALPYVDIIFGNESEAMAISEALKLSTNNIVEIAQSLADLPKASNDHHHVERKIIITNGGEPTIVVTPSQVQSFPVEEIPSTQIIDTNGAGDAFAGGFLSQLVQGKPLSTCIKAGHYTAGVIIRRSGVTFPPKPDPSFTF